MDCLEITCDERGVARVALHRPAVHNAFNQQLIDELTVAFLALHDDPQVRVVVLEGKGKHFSAGADVEWMRQQAEADGEANRASARSMAAMFNIVDRCSKPVVGRIQGAALGGGSGLTALMDIAIAHPEALFGFTEVRLGILPAVISPFVIRKIGYSQARARFLTGSRFNGQEAFQIGLVHFVAEDLDSKVNEVVDELLKGAPAAHKACKRLLNEVNGVAPERARELTVEYIARARSSTEGREGLSAFLEKRSPKWSC